MKVIPLFSKHAFNWSKVTVKTFIMLQKIFILNKCCSFELSIHQRILKKMYHCFHKNIKQHKEDVTLEMGVMTAENTALPSQE